LQPRRRRNLARAYRHRMLQVTKILGSQANFDLTGFGDQLAHPNFPAGAI